MSSFERMPDGLAKVMASGGPGLAASPMASNLAGGARAPRDIDRSEPCARGWLSGSQTPRICAWPDPKSRRADKEEPGKTTEQAGSCAKGSQVRSGWKPQIEQEASTKEKVYPRCNP